MRTIFYSLIAGALLTSCAASSVSPITGLWYTDVKANQAVTSNALGKKVGTAKLESILGLIGTGDASVETAAKNANISKISHVDYHSKSILGLYATYEVFVYGE